MRGEFKAGMTLKGWMPSSFVIIRYAYGDRIVGGKEAKPKMKCAELAGVL